MGAVAYGILLLAAVVGFAHILKLCEGFILRSNQPVSVITVAPLAGHIEDMELLARELRTGNNKRRQTRVLLVDTGMDAQTRAVCEKLSKDFDDLILCEDSRAGTLLDQGIAYAQKQS